MKNLVLYEPCANCPFRTDRPAFLTKGRAKGIVKDLISDKHFKCHKTIDYETSPPSNTPRTAICAGFAVLAESINHPTQLMRIAERLGFYDKGKLNMNAPVHKTAESFIEAQSGKVPSSTVQKETVK